MNKFSFNPDPDVLDVAPLVKQISAILEQKEIEQAFELAYSGNYLGAEHLLVKIINISPSHEAYDLLARIKAQQGDINQAEFFWKKALEINPDCKDCQKSLNKINIIQNTRIRYKSYFIPILLKGLGIIGLIALVTGLIMAINHLSNKVNSVSIQFGQISTIISEPRITISSQEQPQSNVLVASVNENNNLLHALSTQIAEPTQITIQTLEPLTPNFDFQISVEGVSSVNLGDRVELIFENGLFSYETLITPGGKQTLRELGAQLKLHSRNIQVEVIGFTDSLETQRNDLELSRASTVINYLETVIPLPETMFTISQPGERAAPFDNTSIQGRKLNRTVMIVIYPNNR